MALRTMTLTRNPKHAGPQDNFKFYLKNIKTQKPYEVVCDKRTRFIDTLPGGMLTDLLKTRFTSPLSNARKQIYFNVFDLFKSVADLGIKHGDTVNYFSFTTECIYDPCDVRKATQPITHKRKFWIIRTKGKEQSSNIYLCENFNKGKKILASVSLTFPHRTESFILENVEIEFTGNKKQIENYPLRLIINRDKDLFSQFPVVQLTPHSTTALKALIAYRFSPSDNRVFIHDSNNHQGKMPNEKLARQEALKQKIPNLKMNNLDMNRTVTVYSWSRSFFSPKRLLSFENYLIDMVDKNTNKAKTIIAAIENRHEGQLMQALGEHRGFIRRCFSFGTETTGMKIYKQIK